MTPIVVIWLNFKPFFLKNSNSDKYCTLLTRLFYYYQFFQKFQFLHNTAFTTYTKTYLLSVFSGNWLETFCILLKTDLTSTITCAKPIFFSRGKESYELILILT